MKYKELYNEYSSLVSEKNDYIKTMPTLSDGYISTKKISCKHYFYLQKRVGKRIKSEYIRKALLPQIKSELKKRAELKIRITQINEQLEKIEFAVNLLDLPLYRKLVILKHAAAMDTLPLDMRNESLAFGNAMAALEGLPVSEDTEKCLSLWADGQSGFTDGYLQTLQKYNLIEV